MKKLVHNYGNFNYKVHVLFKKMHFFETFLLITGKNNKEDKQLSLNNTIYIQVCQYSCNHHDSSSPDDSFNVPMRHAPVSVVDIHGEAYLIPTRLDGSLPQLHSSEVFG